MCIGGGVPSAASTGPSPSRGSGGSLGCCPSSHPPHSPVPTGHGATPEQTPVPQVRAQGPRLAWLPGGTHTSCASGSRTGRGGGCGGRGGDAGAQLLRGGPSGLFLMGWMGLGPPGCWHFGDQGSVTCTEESGSIPGDGPIPFPWLLPSIGDFSSWERHLVPAWSHCPGLGDPPAPDSGTRRGPSQARLSSQQGWREAGLCWGGVGSEVGRRGPFGTWCHSQNNAWQSWPGQAGGR